MANQTRRTFLAQGAIALTSVGCRAHRLPDEERSHQPTALQLASMRTVALRFMGRYGVPGMSISIAVLGKTLYEQSFGLADNTSNETLTPSHLFRIASISKPITSVAIFRLIERGVLHASDLVFGPDGILRDDFGPTAKQPYLAQLKIEHLLTHTGGGWQNDMTDPMFRDPQIGQHELIAWTLANQPLTNVPGKHFAYSNFGYCVLGRVIEKVTQKSYADFVTTEVLSRCGIADMRIAGNTLADRAPHEVVYDARTENPYNMNVRRMDSHGGWLATASDLVRFATHVDDFTTTPNIRRHETINAMTTPTAPNSGYAHGWAVNSQGNWWHGGSLPGTSTIMVRTHSGLCWAALTNTRKMGEMGNDLDQMMWDIVKAVPEWQA
jgi:CubicO group peptidase (beta-lactamase class C family)